MNVFEIEDEMKIARNCVYVIPPNHDLFIRNGTLQLQSPTTPRAFHFPIDSFFQSLAEDQHEQAIGIILSGTGSDGSLGARAIKAEGGIMIAQTPESSEYNGMPSNAIGTGLMDYVLAPEAIPTQLFSYTTTAFGNLLSKPATDQNDPSLKKICALVKAKTGHDFSHYKQTTIIRRIQRRMAIQHINRLTEYINFLQQNPTEIESLFLDFMIGVTHFFRDPEAFDRLREKVIPALFEGKPQGSTIRVWVPGCSTGEEAYSIAILLHEEMERLKQQFTILVFATDLDHRAIKQARTGIYPAHIANELSSERFTRFFTQLPDSCCIQKRIRDLLIFSEQDLIKDPPFSKLDLISCRNLLIYMDGDLQKKLIPLFHYSLNPNGYLFLGTSESTGCSEDLFTTLDRTAKLYQRKEGKKRSTTQAPFPLLTESPNLRIVPSTSQQPKITMRELTQQTLLQHYTPASVLINVNGDVLYLHGQTGDYLEPSPGEPTMNIHKMAREGLRQSLAHTLHQAVLSKKPTQHSGLRIKSKDRVILVNLTIRPVNIESETTSSDPLFLVILEEAQEMPQIQETAPSAEMDMDERIISLKKEIQSKEAYLQSTNEKLENSNQELRSSNEEMQSINEELQSTNEEMETTREELQSVNEELSTVNAELQTKLLDLSQANNDMNNLLAGTGMGTLFVDHQQRIKRFTPAITELINLIEGDLGRPLAHLVSNLVSYDRLVDDVKEVLDTLIPKEIEVQSKKGIWYLLRIRPYRTLENVIEGAAITFVDINRLKETQAALMEASRRLAVITKDSRDAVTAQTMDGRILAWNATAERMYGWSESEALQMNIREMIPKDQRDEAIREIQTLARTQMTEPYKMKRLTKDGEVIDVWVIATVLLNQSQEAYAIATTERI